MRLAKDLLLAVDGLASLVGLDRMLCRHGSGSWTILMYHRVLPEADAAAYPLQNLVVSASDFALQMGWLAQRAEVLPVGVALAERARGGPRRRPLVSVTFDDGYLDNYEVAAPVLARHGLHATFFVTTGFVLGRPLWFDVAAHAHGALGPSRARKLAGVAGAGSSLGGFLGALKRMPADRRVRAAELLEHEAPPSRAGRPLLAMQPAHLQRLEVLGHEIGAHTHTHPLLPDLGTDEIEVEIAESRDHIRDWTGAAPTGFCYPNGSQDQRVRSATERAGFRYACTTLRGANGRDEDPFALRRRMIADSSAGRGSSGRGRAAFAAEVSGLHDGYRRVWRWSRHRLGGRPSPRAGSEGTDLA